MRTTRPGMSICSSTRHLRLPASSRVLLRYHTQESINFDLKVLPGMKCIVHVCAGLSEG